MKLVKRFNWRNMIKMIMVVVIMVMSSMTVSKDAEATEVLVSGFWQYYVITSGDLGDIGCVSIVGYTGAESDLKIPSKIAGKKVSRVKGISGNKYVESVNVPNSVIQIGWGAFSNCENLKKITGMKGVKYISDYAFRDCTMLKSVNTTNELRSIGIGAFNNTAISNIYLPEGVEEISLGAFENCTDLKKVTVPSTILYLGDKTFNGCTGLVEAIVKTDVPSSVFKNCINLQNVTLINAREISGYAFSGCSSLKNIKLPSTLRSISWSAFYNCSSLENVDLPYGIVSLNMGAFSGCEKLTDLVIPNSIAIMNNSVFERNTYIKNITIPNSVSDIFEYKETGDDIRYAVNYKIWNINCYAGSVAEQFAKENKLNYNLMTEKTSTSLSISEKKIQIVDGDIRQIKYKIVPSDTTDAIVWESSDVNIAKVNAIGEVEGTGIGCATIIATTTSGKRATVTVVVSKKPRTIYFEDEEKVCLKGMSFTQKVIAKDDNGNIRKDVTAIYRSSDSSIATVNKNGKITGKKTGTAAIVAQVAGEKLVYRIKVVNSVSIANKHIHTALAKYSYIYDGKVKKTAIKVTFEGEKLKKGKDYTVSYSNNKKIGTAKVTIKGKGKYNGKKVITFKILKR